MDLPKQLTKDLIEMYREREYLWRVNSEDYRKRDLRMKGYQEIVDYLKAQGMHEATDTLVRDKIQNMRRSVRKERNKMDRYAGYVTHLWYYDLLKYVLKQDKIPNSKTKNTRIKIQEVSDSDSSNDPLDEAPLHIHEQNQEEDSETDEKTEERKSDVTYVRNPDEFEALGIGIAAKVRRMESTQRIYAELLVQKVLARGMLGTLNETTDLSDMNNK